MNHLSFIVQPIGLKAIFSSLVFIFKPTQRYYKDKICEDCRLVVTASFAFCIITFELIEFQTRSAPQNDRVNLSFVKYVYVDGGKLTRDGRKTAMNS